MKRAFNLAYTNDDECLLIPCDRNKKIKKTHESTRG